MTLASFWTPFSGRIRLLERGERGVAFLGIALALILITGFAANTWLIDRNNSEALSSERLSNINIIGPLLADRAQRFISTGDLPGLRRFIANCGTSLKLDGCTVSLGSGRIVADTTAARVNTFEVPQRWTVAAADDLAAEPDGVASFQFPFAVPGKGAGLVGMAPLPASKGGDSSFAPSALLCAAGLCLLIFVYRRSRRGLAEMELIANSLSAMEGGETAAPALKIDEELGAACRTWNKLLDELEELRRRGALSQAVASIGNRRAGGNNLEAACDAMSQGLVLIDDKMRVRFSNGAACNFLKMDRSSLAGTAVADLVQDEKVHSAIVSIASGALRRPVTMELEQPSDSGTGVLRFCVRPVRRGDADSAMILIEDITQQRTAERARNTFINQVTHELRTPLTNIRLYTETAMGDGENDAEVRANCLNVINQESRRLERIVNEMLSVAEIEAGSSTVHRGEVYFDVLLDELRADYRAQAEEKGITLMFDVAPALPKVYADKDKLSIALHNLIGNALKYTPTGGKVTVTVDVRDGQLAVDVADTGIGIKPEETEKIFDRFFRSGDPRVGKIIGTGLGLTLAREVMRLHGGDVTVQSVIDRGSTFTATLPLGNAA